MKSPVAAIEVAAVALEATAVALEATAVALEATMEAATTPAVKPLAPAAVAWPPAPPARPPAPPAGMPDRHPAEEQEEDQSQCRPKRSHACGTHLSIRVFKGRAREIGDFLRRREPLNEGRPTGVKSITK
jgi:hypothetical protein